MDEEISHLLLLQPPLWVQKPSALSNANGLIGQEVQLRQRRRLATNMAVDLLGPK